MEACLTKLKVTTLKLLGAAGMLASALASPAMAQEVISEPGYCAQFYPNANCQNKGSGNPYTGDYQRRRAAYDGYRYRQGQGWNGDWNNGWPNGWRQNWR